MVPDLSPWMDEDLELFRGTVARFLEDDGLPRLDLPADYGGGAVDSRVQRIYGGTNEIMKEVIARSI